MKKIVFLLIFLIIFVPLLYGAQVDISGWSLMTKTKTDTNANDASTMSAETDTVVWTPASGNKIILMGIKFNSETATTLLIESGSTAVIPLTECTASGQIVIQSSVPIWQGADDATLTYTVETKGRHSILLWGYELE